jgi:hypothetical protein
MMSVMFTTEAWAESAARPAWVTSCVDRFEKAAASLRSAKLDLGTAKVLPMPEDPPLYCDQRNWGVEIDAVVDGKHYAALAGTNRDEGGDGKWRLTTLPGQPKSWARRSPGQLGRVASDAIPGPALDKFAKTFQVAIDACLADAPKLPPAPPDDPQWTTHCQAQPSGRSSAWVKVCVAAERAASDLERMCAWEDERVAGRPGHGWLAMQRVLALGPDAGPVLQRLAKSKNPVARIAAARGFGLVRTDEARVALGQLTSDSAAVPTRVGDQRQLRTVGSFAKEALTAYPR